MANLHGAVSECCHLPIINTLDCMLKVMARVGIVADLSCPLSNERAYDVMLPQEGYLS